MPSARPRGTIVTLCRGSRPGTLRLTSAWPASWYAVRRRSSSESTMLLRSRPSITLSLASSRSFMSTAPLLRRAASRAASLTTFDSPAPDRPGVPLALRSRFTPVASGILRVWTRRICSRPFTSGMSTTICRSNRPGRSSAGPRPPRLARHGLGEQRLAGARGADQEGAFGQPAAQPLEFLGILEEVDDLLELLLRLVAPRHVGERDLRRVAREELRLGFSEGEGPVPPLLHLSQHEDDEPED